MKTTTTIKSASAIACAAAVLGGIPAAAQPMPQASVVTQPSAVAPAAATVAVTAAPTVRTIEVGKAFRVVGRAPARSKVYLQQYVGRGRWLNVGRAVTASRSGSYVVAGAVSAAGPAAFRALAVVGKTSAMSRNFAITGLAWFNLNDIDSADRHYATYEENLVNINGRSYPKSIRSNAYGTGFIAWNVNRVCTKLRATIGVEDRSDSDAVGQLQVFKDDQDVVNETMSFGASKFVLADISGSLRVRLAATRLTKNRAHLAFGTPQVLCSRDLTD